MMKVGYLGPEGTFSEEASTLYEKKIGSADFMSYSTFHDILIDVDKGNIDEGIVPIENSVEGTIGIVTDMLVNDVNLKIRQEIVVPVKHYLLAKDKVNLNQITEVISHPQAIDQCKLYLRKHLPKAKIHFAYSTSEAAKQVASTMTLSSKDVPAAISTKASAKLYKLEIIAEGINDYKDNCTRFVVLAKKGHDKTGKDKTSIVFSILKDRPGGLYDILGEFAQRHINLTKIESRPTKMTLGEYYFFIDIQGHGTDKIVSDALDKIKKKASFFKILGSYPQAS